MMGRNGCATGWLLWFFLSMDRASCQTTLLNYFTTTTDVSSELNLAKDIAMMREVEDGTGAADEERQREIYSNGENSVITSGDGVGTKRSIASLSLNAETTMSQDFWYNIYKRAFYDLGANVEEETAGNFDDEPVADYANTIVNDLFALDLPGIETEAALILNVWMAIAHELWELLMACQRNDGNTDADMSGSVDRAAALWIGAGQVRGDTERGQLLYNLAQKAGELFGQNDISNSNEVKVNTFMLDAFNELQNEVSNSRCADGNEGFNDVRLIVNQIYSYMSVPLVQQLIHHIRKQTSAINGDERDFIELYALAIMPQVAFCDPAVHDAMVDLFVTGTLDPRDRDTAIQVLQSTYSCMHITCEMVGSYNSGEVEQCSDVATTPKKYAGYQPDHNAVQWSYIDRDIAQFRVLLLEQAYDAARDLYMNGRNSRPGTDYLSLQVLATFIGRNLVPQMGIFDDYFDVANEEGSDYADNIITKVLDQSGQYKNLSPSMLTEIGVGATQYMVMYMAVLQKVYIAVDKCATESPADALDEWDQGVAMFVGSMEGEDDGGSPDGYGELLYGAGKFYCNFFNSCVDGGVNTKVNEDIMASFAGGRTLLEKNDCQSVRDTVEFIVEDIIVPIIQGTLHYSVLNDEPDPVDLDDASLGAGYILAQSLIPLVDDVDEQSATTIDENTNILSRVGSSDSAAVFNAVKTAIIANLVVDCDVIGVYDDRADGNVCDGNVSTPPPDSNGSLAFGRYPFSSNDNPLAKIALDIRDMTTSEKAVALQIYSQGKNAIVAGGNGEEPTTLTAADFSTEASQVMAQDPMYNTYRFAFRDDKDFTDEDSQYGDVTVKDALDYDLVQLAADAAVALNIWMAITNNLYQAVRDCQAGNKDSFRLDNAVALWIGEDQVENGAGGWLLYAMAETAARRFQQISVEAPVNTKLIDLFNEANAVTSSCAANSGAYLELRDKVSQILVQMSIPLLQELIYYLQVGSGDGNYVKLYSLSVVPQVAACEPSAFYYLKENLIKPDYESVDASKLDLIMENLAPLLGCLRITCDDLLIPRDEDGSFSAPLNLLCDGAVDETSPMAIAGYAPASNVYEHSRIDLDVLQIEILMETLAYEAARDYYVNGYNSKPGGTVTSLQKLATNSARAVVPLQYELFKTYFGDSDTYADDIIMQGFNNENSQFEGASRQQLTEVVVGTIRTMVTYMSVLQQFFVAAEECDGVIEDSGLTAWDIGVAWFVGSIEGQQQGGAADGGGQLLYSLGKEMCESFSTCENSGNAASNERLVDSFTRGRSLLEQEDCANTLTLITTKILPVIPVPLIQGALDLASENEVLDRGTTNESLAAGYVFSRAVLPLVSDADETSANTIATNMAFQLIEQPVKDGSDAVYSAFADALPQMTVDCADIGTSNDEMKRSVCLGDTGSYKPKPSSTPTNLSEGLYTTTTYVQDRANIALDVRDIEKHLTNGNFDLAKLIYTTGDNSQIFNENGIITGTRSLSSFSTTASLEMIGEPEFSIFQYALQDANGEYLAKEARVYADTIVLEAFASAVKTSTRTLASEAVVVLNLWMFVVHELYEALDHCKNKVVADADGVHSIDEVAAYWIGDGQQSGDAERGHLLYALTEQHGELFGLEEGDQSRTNTNILRLLNQAKLELTVPNACTDDPKTFPRLREIVNKMIPQMLVPLIQGLIHNLKENDRDRVKLYAQAFVPLVAGCNPDTFDFLYDKLISLNYNAVEIDSILDSISSTYVCFGLSCNDIGTYQADESFSCTDPPDLFPLAGYRPETNVNEQAQHDLDILELEVLMKMEAYEAARDLYELGKHVVIGNSDGQRTLSLRELATTADRQRVPSYDTFIRYYDDDKYADTMVEKGLDITSDLSPEQRTEIVVKTCQYMVVYMAALAALHEALENCRSNKIQDAEVSWDQAVALLIGSLEGTLDGGSEAGHLHYGLAKKRCSQFGTCVKDPHNAEVNVRIIELFYAGRAELNAQSCSALEKAVGGIESLLLVPLIQSTLRYVIANNGNLFNRDGGIAEGFVFSRSILPLVDDANRESAAVIATALDMSADKADRDAAAVFDALAQAYNGMGVDCALVGSTASGASACEGAEGLESGDDGPSGGVIAGAVIGSLAAAALILFGVVRYQKKRKEKANSETASLVTNETGVLDADSSGQENTPRPEQSPENVSFVRNSTGVMDGEDGGDEHSPELLISRDTSHDELV